jgi:uroporphyrinogen-III synthase
VARPADRGATLVDALRQAGLATVHVPAIETVLAPDEPVDAAVRATRAGDWMIVTSAMGAAGAIAAIARTGIATQTRRWAAVGSATAAALAAAGISDVFVPTTEAGEGLARELPITDGDHVLLARGDLADETLPLALRARGADVTEVVTYQTREAPERSRPLLSTALDDGPIDALVLTSGSTARGLLGLAADGSIRARILATPVIAIGQPTASVATELGFAKVLVSPAPDTRSLAAFVAHALGVDAESVPANPTNPALAAIPANNGALS